MAPRLSGQTSISGVVFFVFESLLGIERQKKLKKITILTRSHVRILIYRTWPIEKGIKVFSCHGRNRIRLRVKFWFCLPEQHFVD